MYYSASPSKKKRKLKHLNGAKSFGTIRTVTVYVTYVAKKKTWNKRNGIWYHETPERYEEMTFTITPKIIVTNEVMVQLISNTDAHLEMMMDGFELLGYQYDPTGPTYKKEENLQ